jgi:hypothetical protein
MKKLNPLSLKHLVRYLLRYLVIAGVILGTVLVITACEEAAAGTDDGGGTASPDDGGGTASPVDGVSPVSLSESASTSDFETFIAGSDANLVNDKTDVLYLLGIAGATVMENVEDYLNDMEAAGDPWGPSNDESTYTIDPLDLFELNDPPSSMEISGVLVNEALGGFLTINADGTLSADMVWNADDMPNSITASAEGEFHSPLIGTMVDPWYDTDIVHGGSIHAAMAANVSVGFQWEEVHNTDYPEEYWYEPVFIAANAAMSTRISVAVSAEGDIRDYMTKLVYGHLLVTIAWDPQVELVIDESMLNGESGDALMTYLEGIEIDEPTVTVEVYDHGSASPAHTFNYTIEDLTAMFEGGEEEYSEEFMSSILSRLSR